MTSTGLAFSQGLEISVAKQKPDQTDLCNWIQLTKQFLI